MDHFRFIDGALHCEGVAVDDVAKAVGTPCFIYSRATLLEHLRRIRTAFAPLQAQVRYSVKCCSNLSILRLLVRAGAGMDVVSAGELRRALEAGCPAEHCVQAGVGKRDDEIALAIRSGIGLFNVEGEQEFDAIADIARRLGRRCEGALRINPDVDPKTHRHTSTGHRATKFGVAAGQARALLRRGAADPWFRLRGIHLHIGSPVYDTAPYVEAITCATRLMDDLAAEGVSLDTLDIGGGFGADYVSGQSPGAGDYAAAIVPLLEDRVRAGLRVILEPGRSIAANAGCLILGVVFTKESAGRTYVICDAGMNALLRPSHYDAFHFAWPTRPGPSMVPPSRTPEPALEGLVPCDIVGPLCETGDYLALGRHIPPVERGSRLAVFTAGAYGMTMASRYNSSPLPAEVLVEGDSFSIIRARETYDDMVSHERVGALAESGA